MNARNLASSIAASLSASATASAKRLASAASASTLALAICSSSFFHTNFAAALQRSSTAIKSRFSILVLSSKAASRFFASRSSLIFFKRSSRSRLSISLRTLFSSSLFCLRIFFSSSSITRFAYSSFNLASSSAAIISPNSSSSSASLCLNLVNLSNSSFSNSSTVIDGKLPLPLIRGSSINNICILLADLSNVLSSCVIKSISGKNDISTKFIIAINSLFPIVSGYPALGNLCIRNEAFNSSHAVLLTPLPLKFLKDE